MRIIENANLAECTSFGTGGKSDIFAHVETIEEVREALQTLPKPFWVLGKGANTLISDEGLPGTTLHIELQDIAFNDNLVIAGAGTNWDRLVTESIAQNLWGLELMSGIPGTVGAAVVGNIAAYGQAVADTLAWIRVIDSEAPEEIRTMQPEELDLAYRSSAFTKGRYNNIIILEVAFQLSNTPTMDLEYESALKIARELNLKPDTLEHRRDIIMEARNRAGSLFDKTHTIKTAGSFFKNPMVTAEQADYVTSFEERGVSHAQILKQNKIHGGDTHRVSAAHVLLAAGFRTGQTWGPVRIHPDHVLKIENTGEATSQQIYDVAMEIITTVKEKLDITLEPEVRFMGSFEK